MKQAEEIALKIPTDDTRSGRKIVEFDGVGKTIHGKRPFSDLTLGLVAGDRIGVVGANGHGNTTLMRMIQGMETVEEGSIEICASTVEATECEPSFALRVDLATV